MLDLKEVTKIIQQVQNLAKETSNVMCIVGEVLKNPKHCKNHIIETTVSCKRLSGIFDTIPTKIYSEHNIKKGKKYIMVGELRSRDVTVREKKHVKIYFEVKYVKPVNPEIEDYNFIFLKGYICKKNELRVTPKKRTISSTIIRVKNEGKTSYIPVITWDQKAYLFDKNEIGKEVLIQGRIQSREYFKQKERCTTYEVMTQHFEVI